jgi:hypothetical protein
MHKTGWTKPRAGIMGIARLDACQDDGKNDIGSAELPVGKLAGGMDLSMSPRFLDAYRLAFLDARAR